MGSNKKIKWGEEIKLAGRVLISGIGKFFKAFLNVLITILLICALTGIIVVCAFTVYINNYIETEIDADQFRMNITTSTTTHIYRYEFTDRPNRVGEVVPMESDSDFRLQGDADQIYVPYEKIPDNMINAIIAIEDKRFMTNSGVDWKRTIAAGANFFLGFDESGYGGSSITQQLIKNVTRNDDYSIQRKIQEIFWALDLETKMDKEEILELYLNIVNFGNGCNGVQAAAYSYFSKDVSELTLIECAAIASITKNPSRFNPIYYPEYNAERRDTVIYEMYDQGLITHREFEEAFGKELVLNQPGSNDDGDEDDSDELPVNSWYTDMVIQDVINDLVEQKGYSSKMASLLVYNGGLNIVSLVDPVVQEELEKSMMDDSLFPEDKSGIKAQASAIVIDPQTGDILAVVGSRGEKTANRILNYATMTRRSPGSSIKPLSVYAPSVEKGLITWSSVYDDVPYSFENDIAWPKNSSGTYRGLSNINYSIKRSLNTVAIRVLDDLGLEDAFDFCYNTLEMKNMITSIKTESGGTLTDIGYASLGLGQLTYGITNREITAAYSIFANDGVYNEPHSYLTVTDSEGNVILENKYSGKVAISEETADLMTLMLENVVKSGTASSLTFGTTTGIDVAGKTGSAGDYYDRWFIGYTPYYICGVWYGYEYQKTINANFNPAVKVWDDVMTNVHKLKVLDKVEAGEEELKSFDISNNIIEVTYCVDSGLLYNKDTCGHDPRGNRTETGYFIKGTEPTEYCDRHILVDYDVVNKGVACKYCPPENIEQVALVKIEQRHLGYVMYVTDAQYTYVELPYDVMPYNDKSRVFYNSLWKKGDYPGLSYATEQFNALCTDHFDEELWEMELEALKKDPDALDELLNSGTPIYFRRGLILDFFSLIEP